SPETQDDASVSKLIRTGRSSKGGFVRGYVRFGSKADICNAIRNVRFTPESGHSRIRSLPARSGNKAPDLCPAFVVLVWPYHGEPKFVWCSYQRSGPPLHPLAFKSHSIFAVLRIPIHILDALAISERAAKPSPACKAVE